MNRKLIIILLLPIVLLYMGCPVSTKYPIAKPGTEKIDKSLLGTWRNTTSDSEGEALLVTISQADTYSYSVAVLEKGSMYSPEDTLLVGYIAKLEGKSFFYVRPVSKTDEFYLYCYKTDGEKVKTYDVTLKVGGIDAITSIDTYRQEVIQSLKFEDCLQDEIVWAKINQ